MYNMGALKSDGSAWMWGANNSGQLGNNAALTASVSSPVAVIGAHSFDRLAMFCDSVSIPIDTSIAGLKANDGSTWMWGINSYGGIGNNTLTSYSSPVAVVGSHVFNDVRAQGFFTIARKADGSVWSWGVNTAGQLGTGNVTSYSSPVAVVGGHIFVKMSASQSGYFCIGLKADGSAWSWGVNESGQLGTNNVTSYSSPVAVVGNHSFIKITAGLAQSYGLKADGSLWAWGLNDIGQLGNNTRTSYSSPVAVVGNHSFVDMASAYSHVIALKADGSAWCWGRNANGQCGTNNLTSYSSPVAVVGNHSFIQIASARSAMAGLKSNGSVWTWGYNGFGQLGDNSITDKSSPVAVVGAHTFVKLWHQDELSTVCVSLFDQYC